MNTQDIESKLGRLPALDNRDTQFHIRTILPEKAVAITSRFWNDTSVFLDQGNTPKCVDYGWHHWMIDGPVTHGKKHIWEPGSLYARAQQIDEWPGEDYDGTSVRAGAKTLLEWGMIKEYRWAWDVQTLVDAVLTTGPVVVGTNFYYDMAFPNTKGLIKVSGSVIGGHCYVINGVNTKTKVFRIKNSWGRGWGINGRAFISFDDMQRLIAEDGEICLAVENKTA
jgi:hypothetical protein